MSERTNFEKITESPEALEEYITPHLLDYWYEDVGSVLWWKFPIEEPPYSGTPLDEEWPGYHTHWTFIPMPKLPASE